MKTKLEEIKRLQKLAGIINESSIQKDEFLYEETSISDKEIANAISKITKGAVPPDAVNVDKLENNPDSPDAIDKSKIKKSSSDANKKELDEIALSATLALLAPTIIELVGEKINSIKQKNLSTYQTPANIEKSQELKKEIERLKAEKERLDREDKHDEENEVVEKLKELEHEYQKITGFGVGNAFINVAHKLHKAYVFPIKAIFDGVAWYNRVWNKEQGKKDSRFTRDERYRENLANLVYCAIMIFVSIYSFTSHPIEAAEKLSKQTGGLISVSQITNLVSHIKTTNSLKDAITSALETA